MCSAPAIGNRCAFIEIGEHTLVAPTRVGAPQSGFQQPDKSLVYSGFHQRRTWAVPAAEAEVASRLFSEARKENVPITQKMNEALKAYRELPGIPRRTYLYYANPSDVNYLPALKDAIGDPDQPLYELQIVIQSNAPRTTVMGWSDNMELSVNRRKELRSMVQNLDR